MKAQGATNQRDIVTSLRLTQDEHRCLKELAASQQRSVSGQLRFIVAQLCAEASSGPKGSS